MTSNIINPHETQSGVSPLLSMSNNLTYQSTLVQGFLLKMNVWAKLFFCFVFTLPTLTINVSWSIITYISFITNAWSQRSKGFISKTLEILGLWEVTELKTVEHDSIHESKNVLNNGCYFPDNNVSNAAWRKSISTN